MKQNKMLWIAVAMVFSLFVFSVIVEADDDHNHRSNHYKYEYRDHDFYNDHDDYDDEEDDYKGQHIFKTKNSKEYWFKWSRIAEQPKEFEKLPINEEGEVLLKIENAEPIKINAIPSGSQLLVPLETVAKYLGATSTIYPNSEIIEITKGEKHLIVRNNSRVVYENMRKTPMQRPIIKQNNDYYIAISVLANGLGFEIKETVENNEIQLKG